MPASDFALNPDAVASLLAATHGDPFSILGHHGRTLTVFRPDARRVWVSAGEQQPTELTRVDEAGLFAGEVPEDLAADYQLTCENFGGDRWTSRDPYSFGNLLGELDMHFLAEGSDRQLHRKLGAHRLAVDGVEGVRFAVWAPNARRVSVIGDWNMWDGRIHPMKKRIESGIWEIFIPGLHFGLHYQFEVLGADSHLRKKGDPVGYFHQSRGQCASLLWDISQYQWADHRWLDQRAQNDSWHQAVSIYELHVGSWMRVPEDGNRMLTWRELAPKLIAHITRLGFTHVELMPITEYPFDGSWGYQVTGYFAPTSRHGSPEDFKYFIDQLHQAGIGVILDWVPAHFPKDEFGLARFDGTPLYEHADPREGEHKDWGTLIFNLGRNEVRNFLISSALFWLEEYHIDGLRVDAVASMLYRDYSRENGEWVPNRFGGRENLETIDFLRELNHVCHAHHPGVLMIAEESTAWGGVSHPVSQGGLGFGYKWNMGWMNDTLRFMERDAIHRGHHLGEATFSLIYNWDENFVLVLSHDEVVHGKGSLLRKMPGDEWQQFANLRLLYTWMWLHPGKKLLFMGAELGSWEEWRETDSLPWHLEQWERHAGLGHLLTDLNALYRGEPALATTDHDSRSFFWIDCNDSSRSTLSFCRRSQDGELILTVLNFTPVQRDGFILGVPAAGRWEEVLNSDASRYGGGNQGNGGELHTTAEESHGHPQRLSLTLPALAGLVFRHRPE